MVDLLSIVTLTGRKMIVAIATVSIIVAVALYFFIDQLIAPREAVRSDVQHPPDWMA